MMLISILCLDMQCQFCWHILPELFCRMWNWPLGQWYLEISLNSERKLFKWTPTPQTLPLMSLTKLSSTRAGGKIGRHHYILLRLIPCSSCHLAKGWEETKNLKKQIPQDSFHRKPTKCIGWGMCIQGCYQNSLANALPTQWFLLSISKVVGRRRWFKVWPPALGRIESRVVERREPGLTSSCLLCTLSLFSAKLPSAIPFCALQQSWWQTEDSRCQVKTRRNYFS